MGVLHTWLSQHTDTFGHIGHPPSRAIAVYLFSVHGHGRAWPPIRYHSAHDAEWYHIGGVLWLQPEREKRYTPSNRMSASERTETREEW